MNKYHIKEIQKLHANVSKTCNKHPNGQSHCHQCWLCKIHRLAFSTLLARIKYENI